MFLYIVLISLRKNSSYSFVIMENCDTPNICGAEAFKGTVYGPAKYLSRHAKRYRMMNREELDKYDKKVKQTKGFDVDGCTGCLPGRIVPLTPGSFWWELAGFAAEKYGEDKGLSLKFISLDKANGQPVQGSMFYLTFTAEDSTNQVTKVYRAKVLAEAPSAKLHVKNCTVYKILKKKDDLGKRKNKVLAPVKASKGKVGKREMGHAGGITDGCEASTGAAESRASGLCGFTFFLQTVRSHNPSWTYAMARKTASEKWKGLENWEKQHFITQAGLKFKKISEQRCTAV